MTRSRTLIPILVGSVASLAGCARAEPEPMPAPDAVHYRLDIDVDPPAGTVTTHATIRLAPSQESSRVFVLGGAQRVVRAAAEGARVEVSPTDEPWEGLQKIVVTPSSIGAPIVLQVTTSGPPSPGGSPPINMVTDSLIELSLDGMWLPVEMGFATRFTVDARIRGVPPHMTVLSGGMVRREGDVVVVQRTTPDIDFAFVAAPALHPAGTEQFMLFARDTASESARLFLRHGPAAIAFMEAWFGSYPYRPLRVAMVARERASGYARAGYVVVTEGNRRGDDAVARFVAHELAHAWSPPVDPNSEDRWLQESIAEYVAMRYIEHALGAARLDSVVGAKRAGAAEATALLGLGARSNAELYQKGPLLLLALERRIGRPALDAVLRRVAIERPTRTAQFLRMLEEEAGGDAAAWFHRELST